MSPTIWPVAGSSGKVVAVESVVAVLRGSVVVVVAFFFAATPPPPPPLDVPDGGDGLDCVPGNPPISKEKSQLGAVHIQ